MTPRSQPPFRSPLGGAGLKVLAALPPCPGISPLVSGEAAEHYRTAWAGMADVAAAWEAGGDRPGAEVAAACALKDFSVAMSEAAYARRSWEYLEGAAPEVSPLVTPEPPGGGLRRLAGKGGHWCMDEDGVGGVLREDAVRECLHCTPEGAEAARLRRIYKDTWGTDDLRRGRRRQTGSGAACAPL